MAAVEIGFEWFLPMAAAVKARCGSDHGGRIRRVWCAEKSDKKAAAAQRWLLAIALHEENERWRRCEEEEGEISVREAVAWRRKVRCGRRSLGLPRTSI
jgi:hypothetical protein